MLSHLAAVIATVGVCAISALGAVAIGLLLAPTEGEKPECA